MALVKATFYLAVIILGFTLPVRGDPVFPNDVLYGRHSRSCFFGALVLAPIGTDPTQSATTAVTTQPASKSAIAPTPKPNGKPAKQSGLRRFVSFSESNKGEKTIAAPGAPRIQSLTSSVNAIQLCAVGSSTVVRLHASVLNADCNQLRWTVNGGHIHGNCQEATWDLAGAKPGAYTVTLNVNADSRVTQGFPPFASTRVEVLGCCPLASIYCSEAISGEQPVTCTASTSGGTPGVRPAYHWTITAGRVIGGQGTSSIKVDTTGFSGQGLKGRVELVGYGLDCICSVWASTLVRPAEGGVTVRGEIRNGSSRKGVKYAEITVFLRDQNRIVQSRAQADERGNFVLKELPPGEYQVVVSAQDFFEKSSNVVLRPPTGFVSVSLTAKPLPTPPPHSPSPSPTPSASPSPTPSPAQAPSPPPTTASQFVLSSRLPFQKVPARLPDILLALLLGLATAAILWVVARTAAGLVLGSAKKEDEVHCTVFAPLAASPGDGFLVQVFAHLAEQADQLAAMATEADEDSKARGTKKLDKMIERGKELVFSLNMPGLEIDEPSQSLIWQGEIDSVQFGVTVPEQCKLGSIIGTVRICYESVPIGHVKFKFKIAAVGAQPVQQAEIMPTPPQSFVRYKQAFISYASPDRPEVLKRVQMLKMAKINFFQDLLTLEPGERWEKSIYTHIDESDVFFLFWSSAAKKSEWVAKEVAYALKRKGGNDAVLPEIVPVIIEGPPVVPPPDSLHEFHFNDGLLYFIKAEEAARQSTS
jgi:hypothetical protein